MKTLLKIVLGLLVVILLLASWPAWQLYGEIQKAKSEDPRVWEEAIATLEAESRGKCRPGECVLFVGSSSIRLWDSLAADMAPIPVLQHGFGGAKLNDLVHFAGRLVTPFQPRVVVVFAGTNDIDPAASKSPEVLLASYRALVGKIRARQPEVPIYYIGITPSPLRWSVWPLARETNRLIEDWSAEDEYLHFIDTSQALMGANGEPERDNYIFDGLHLSEKGYGIWTRIIRPLLLRDLELDQPPDALR
jgi:lysophospholipase L1-like esterase